MRYACRLDLFGFVKWTNYVTLSLFNLFRDIVQTSVQHNIGSTSGLSLCSICLADQ